MASPGKYRLDHPMNLSPLNVPSILKRYNLKPDKRLGQNFLLDQSALERILDAAEIQAEDSILEIGPGIGSLTRYLCIKANRVYTVEIDANLIPPLQEVLSDFENVEIIQADILTLEPKDLIEQSCYKVVANIPYYITSKLIRHLLESGHPPDRIVLTVQKEVAMRICAQPGKMSLLSLAVQVYGKPQIFGKIPAGAFYPIPKVDSAIVRVDLYQQPVLQRSHLDIFFRLSKSGFQQKRKTLRNSLGAGLHMTGAKAAELIEAAGIDPRRRPETLSLDEWDKLVEAFEPEL
jgi:16S rRNA (adenine1518-N6/adenine1519-N6)-dimethyltransferase